MSELLDTSIKERLWHKMRAYLTKFVPEIANNRLLMCCACGRFLPQDDFDLEHVIPQQALREDPLEVRNDPATPRNVRARNILLCRKPLLYKNSPLHGSGCNSWKGKHFDGPIADILSGRAVTKSEDKRLYNTHIIGGLILGYLAMVEEFGYITTLMKSGLLLREQFFNPHRFHRNLGSRYQILLSGAPATTVDDPTWSKPFTFKLEHDACYVTARNFVITLPISRDPLAPIAHHLKFAPSRYKMRPDFGTSLT
ncbi:hypothetical protein AB8A31_24105 [Tardiphaga sp. 804_B3_N1_9]|uniref:hypothetical protein n=1 Tax=Tardiphaga TaxID=1395974 RepID=UPI0015861EED|nr:hypothetical protein [Tardiphaga robiniae]NUU44110.1 hypothetical protein [Tardiphaga robiniae]